MSNEIQCLYYFLCILGIFFLGVPGYILFCQNKKVMIPFSCLFGVAEIIFISYWCSISGLTERQIVYVVLTVFVLSWGYLLTKAKKHLIYRFCKQDMLLLLLCSLAGMLPMMPILVFGAAFPYSDEYTYICIADYLLEHGYNEMPALDAYHPWLTQVYLYQLCHLRMGAQFFLSFWTAIAGENYSIILYAPISGVGVFLFGMAVWLYVSDFFASSKATLYAVIFSVFNITIVVWCAEIGFLPQIFGFSFMILGLRGIKNVLKSDVFDKIKILECAFFIVVLAFCYSELIPFLFLFLIIYVFMYGHFGYSMQNSCFRMLFVMLASIALMGAYSLEMIYAIWFQINSPVGWEQSTNWFSYVGYLFSTVPAYFNYAQANNQLLKMSFVIATLFMIIALCRGIKYYTNSNKILLEFVAVSLPYLLLLIYFSSIAQNPFGLGFGNSWSIFKLVQYYFIIISIVIFPFFAYAFNEDKKISKFSVRCFLLGYIFFSVVNNYYYSDKITNEMSEYVGNKENPIIEYFLLENKYKGEKKTINIMDTPENQRKLITYFLRENTLSSDWSTDGYFGVYSSHLGGADPKYDSDGITLKHSPNDSEAIAGMLEVDVNTVTSKPFKGVGQVEKIDNAEHTWTWNDVISIYAVRNYSVKDCEIALSFELSSASPQLSAVSIYLNDRLIDTVNVISGKFTSCLYNVKLQGETKNELKFIYRGELVGPTKNDSRVLALMVRNIGIVKTK